MAMIGDKPGRQQLRGLLGAMVHRHDQTRIRTYPFAIALLNLALCVYVDQHLQNDPFHGLTLFLLGEASFGILCLILVFNAAVAPMLDRTRVLPVDRRIRFLFTLFAMSRHPLLTAWAGSTMLFLLVFSRHTVASVVLTAVLAVLCLSTIMILFSLRVSSTRPGLISVHELVLIVVTLTFLYLIISLTFSTGSASEHIPVISWAAHGIASGRTGDYATAVQDGVFLAVIPVLSLVFGLMRDRGA